MECLNGVARVQLTATKTTNHLEGVQVSRIELIKKGRIQKKEEKNIYNTLILYSLVLLYPILTFFLLRLRFLLDGDGVKDGCCPKT